jgi:hypothetical protein
MKAALGIVIMAFSILLLFNFAILNAPQDDSVSGACTTTLPTRITVTNVSIFVTYTNMTVEHKENVTCTRNDVRAVTVFNVMDENFRIIYDVFSNGYFISKINDAGGNGWTFTIDGTAPGIACNRQPVCNGSVIRWTQV